MWSTATTRIGTPSSGNSNFTMKQWKGLGEVICGISCEDITNMALNSKFKSVTNLFAKQGISCLDDAQVRVTHL